MRQKPHLYFCESRFFIRIVAMIVRTRARNEAKHRFSRYLVMLAGNSVSAKSPREWFLAGCLQLTAV